MKLNGDDAECFWELKAKFFIDVEPGENLCAFLDLLFLNEGSADVASGVFFEIGFLLNTVRAHDMEV